MGWWILKTLCWLYDLSHTSHLYGCSPICMHWWFIRQLCWLKVFSLKPSINTMNGLMFYQTGLLTEFLFTHITHIGFSMLCMCWCVIRLPFWLNSFLRTSQIHGHSPIYMGWWILNTICWLNAFPLIPSTTVYAFVCSEIALWTEWLIAYFT